MKKEYFLTQEGVEELKTEREEAVKSRGDIAQRIATAREFGDLRENAEYQSAKQEQERNEARIGEIEQILRNVKIITKSGNNDSVSLGATVTLKSGKDKKELQVVGTVEADPLEGKISDESPIGQSLLGKKVGDKVELKAGKDNKTFTVESIA